MSFIGVSGLVNFITCFSIAIFVLYKNIRNPLNISFFNLNLSVALYSFGYFFWQLAKDEIQALFWFKILVVGIILINITYLYFVFHFLGLIDKKRNLLRIYTVINFVFIALNLSLALYTHLEPRYNLGFWPTPTPIFHIYLVFWFWQCLYGFYWLLKGLRLHKGIKREQIKYFTISAMLGFVGGATNWPMWYNIHFVPYLNITISLYIGIVAYAIFRYRLMDIKVAITRAGIFSIVYTLVLGIPFWFGYKYHLWMHSTWMMLVLATLGPFIYLYIERKTEQRLLKEQRRYQETLKQASVGMTRIRDLKRLLDLITHIITKTVKISYAGIYLYNKDTNEYVLQVSRDKGRMPVLKLTFASSLIQWLITKRSPLFYEEVKREAQEHNNIAYKQLEEDMRSLMATVFIPSFLNEKLMGFIVLGDKISGQIYTPEDLNVFQILASQAALAIENAQFYEEAKQMQEQIGQAEKMATVGTMADGLSHQINNRFYALSLIAGDTIDTIKLTDTSKCTPEVKEMLNDINRALERIKENVMQGGEVVKGILKYTRKGEEGLEPLALDQILDAALDMLQYKINLSEIDIIRSYAKDLPKIKGNQIQLQEVFFNFCDNAYDAINERKAALQEEGYRGKLNFSAQPKDTLLEITIEDNGMGVREDLSKKVFTPFFTTKTSSHKGTGLGLYVIKKIIADNHKGRVSFESVYKVGTRFIVELPLA